VKAAVNTRYGGPEVVEVRDVPTPEGGPDDVLVRVMASTVGRTDREALRAHPFFARAFTGLLRPRRTILGMDFAGRVEAVGAQVTSFKPGNAVFGLTPGGCGGHAEYVVMPEGGAVAAMPEGLPFAEAVVCEGAHYADTYLRAFGLRPGHTILIYGSSGAIGTAAVQLAKSYGATVTAVTDTRHLALATSLGADRVVDYTVEDFTRLGPQFDFVLDAVGKAGYLRCRPLLKPDGTFSATDLGPWGQNVYALLWHQAIRSRKIIFPIPKSTKGFVEQMSVLLRQGRFRAVIDRRYPLEQIQDAYRYVATGQKTGIVVIDVGSQPGLAHE
jgi:NADPH:quinone reductase-like Zn-dependent oxidoreductase